MEKESRTLTKANIAAAIHTRTGMNSRKALQFVDEIIGLVTGALEAGEKVKIQHFGTFSASDKAARVGRNPKSGTVHEVAARRVVSFHASETLRSRVAQPLPDKMK